MPGGRPTSYKPEYCEAIVKFMATGDSAVAFADEIGVCRDTLLEWSNVHPQFSGAYKKAHAGAQRFWERILKNCAMGLPLKIDGQIYKNYNVVAMIFLMKARFKDYHELKLQVEETRKNIPLAYVPKSKRTG